LQHLKFKFGDTFFIEFKIPSAQHDALTSFMSSFRTAKLLEEPWQVMLNYGRTAFVAFDSAFSLVKMFRVVIPTACQPQVRPPPLDLQFVK
jgi:hypothetical protein